MNKCILSFFTIILLFTTNLFSDDLQIELELRQYIEHIKNTSELLNNCENHYYENVLWITEEPFSQEQLKSKDYITSISPGFIFLENDLALLYYVEWNATIRNDNVDFNTYIIDIDGVYKIKKNKNNTFKVAVYELFFENESLYVKSVSESNSNIRKYFPKSKIFNENKMPTNIY